MTEQRERIAELEGQVADLVRRIAPPGWQRIDVRCTATVAVSDVALTMLTGDREIVTAGSVPDELTALLLDLRRASYRLERGTWFSMAAIVEPGAAHFHYDRDHDPVWDPPAPADAWRRDQVVMPRDDAHIPGWLRDRMEGREPAERPVPDPGPLNPVEQTELLSEGVAGIVADRAPALWLKVSGHYQAVGGHVEFPAVMCLRADRSVKPWRPPAELGALLDRLRAGTHAFQGSTWSRIDFDVVYEEGDVRVRARFVYDDEPGWSAEPSAEDVRRELERFPRGDVPEWMTRRLGPAPQPMTIADTTPPSPPVPPGEAGEADRVAEAGWVGNLQHRLDRLRVDRAAYRIRDTTEGAWCLLPQDGRWAVFHVHGGERRKEIVFGDVEDASAYLLGRLLLDPRHTVQDVPFEPLQGEPPLSLLRDRHVTELAPGTEIDRYGTPDGNVVYTARTPYPQRSLPPEWQERPYHVYRLQRPVEVLTGTAVPWFGQPGGGTAHVFRHPIGDMVADGTLTEM